MLMLRNGIVIIIKYNYHCLKEENNHFHYYFAMEIVLMVTRVMFVKGKFVRKVERHENGLRLCDIVLCKLLHH